MKKTYAPGSNPIRLVLQPRILAGPDRLSNDPGECCNVRYRSLRRVDLGLLIFRRGATVQFELRSRKANLRASTPRVEVASLFILASKWVSLQTSSFPHSL